MSTLPTTVPEFVATMKTEEMLAEILARLQEMNTQLRSLAEPSPPSTSILTADTEEQKAATISSALVTSPSSAPPQNADPGFQSGVTELSYIHRTLPEPPVTTNGSAKQASAPAHGIPFAHGASRLENRASLEVVITTGTGSFHGGSILAASRVGARAPAPVVLSNPGMVRLSHSASWMSTTLLGIMDGGCAEGGIPIEGVDAGILRLGAAYSKKHGPYYDPVASAARLRDPFPPFPIDFTLATVKPVTELLATLPIRCSTLGLYDIACIPVSSAPSSAPSIAFPASTLSQEVVLAIPMVATMNATMSP